MYVYLVGSTNRACAWCYTSSNPNPCVREEIMCHPALKRSGLILSLDHDEFDDVVIKAEWREGPGRLDMSMMRARRDRNRGEAGVRV